jgi:hypothetical protein
VLRRLAKFAVAVTVAAPGFSKAIDDTTIARWAHAGGVSFLIGAAWTEGEAQERGVVVSDADAKEAIAAPHDGLTTSDRIYEARIELLKAGLHAPVSQAAAQSVTNEQIDAYVQTHPPLTDPATRRVRLLIGRNAARAKTIERALRRGVTWDLAGRRYAPSGGPGLLTYQAPPTNALEGQILKAPKNRITRYGRYVFRVIEATPGGPLPPEQQRATAWEILASEAQERAIGAYDAQIAAKWRPVTTCAPALQTQPECGNSPTGQ